MVAGCAVSGGGRGLEPLLSAEGWAYASLPPQEPGDPGRFHALFGRDSLITALQVLPAAPEVARATLRALAARQGRRGRPGDRRGAGQDPARVPAGAPALVRETGWPVRDGRLLYYGTADATSWFLVVLAALGDAALTAELEPRGARRAAGSRARSTRAAGSSATARAAAPAGSPSRAGATRSRRSSTTPRAPASCAPDGTRAGAAARRRRLPGRSRSRRSTRWRGSTPGGWARARRGRARGPGARALGHGGDGARDRGRRARRPGAGSQLGWLLWARALEGAAAARPPSASAQPDVLTPFGLRTLSSAHPAFRAHAYHRGGVWPFDCWLGWGGLRAAGREAEAERVRAGRPGRARPARPGAGARTRSRRPASSSRSPVGQPRPGVDRRRPLGARARLGRRARVA